MLIYHSKDSLDFSGEEAEVYFVIFIYCLSSRFFFGLTKSN